MGSTEKQEMTLFLVRILSSKHDNLVTVEIVGNFRLILQGDIALIQCVTLTAACCSNFCTNIIHAG